MWGIMERGDRMVISLLMCSPPRLHSHIIEKVRMELYLRVSLLPANILFTDPYSFSSHNFHLSINLFVWHKIMITEHPSTKLN